VGARTLSGVWPGWPRHDAGIDSEQLRFLGWEVLQNIQLADDLRTVAVPVDCKILHDYS
jgi:hypothetical protein